MESEMLSAVGQLAAGIAHEICNPRTALMGFTNLLQTGNPNMNYIKIMNTELERINTIVSELLFLSKPKPVEFDDKNIISIPKEVGSLLETQAIMDDIEIIMDLEVEKYTVRCVEHQLKQVFINLVKNAIVAIPKSGKITIRAVLLNESILIEILDEGCRCPRENFRKNRTALLYNEGKGNRAGMMESNKIIQNHDGKMSIKSRADVGTTVQIIM